MPVVDNVVSAVVAEDDGITVALECEARRLRNVGFPDAGASSDGMRFEARMTWMIHKPQHGFPNS